MTLRVYGIVLVIAALLAPATLPTKADQSPATISVERGVVIPILVTKDVRVGAFGASQDEHKVKFAVAQDVIFSGYVIAKAGDLAEGRYVDDVVNFCGDTIHTEFERNFVGGVRSGFLSFGVHGHDAVFGKGSLLEASTDRFEKSVCAEATTASPAPTTR